MGVAVALVGVAVLLIAFGVSSQTTGSIVEGVGSPAILANDNYTHVIPVSPQRSANVEYAWSASKSVRVFLYQAAGCANNTPGYVCPGPELKSWWTDTGIYTYTGSVSEPFLLIVQNVNSTTVLYNGTLVESYPAMSSLGSGWELFVILVGSVILIGFGAIAVFLGVFLRGGSTVLRPSRSDSPIRRSSVGGRTIWTTTGGTTPRPDTIPTTRTTTTCSVARPATDPRTGGSAGGSGRPPPGSRSRAA